MILYDDDFVMAENKVVDAVVEEVKNVFKVNDRGELNPGEMLENQVY